MCEALQEVGSQRLHLYFNTMVARLEPNTQIWNITWPETVEGCNTSNPYWILLNAITKRPLDRNDWLPGTRLLVHQFMERSDQIHRTWLWNLYCAFCFLRRPISQGMGMPKPRLLFTCIQSSASDFNGSQTQIFLFYSVVKSFTT